MPTKIRKSSSTKAIKLRKKKKKTDTFKELVAKRRLVQIKPGLWTSQKQVTRDWKNMDREDDANFSKALKAAGWG